MAVNSGLYFCKNVDIKVHLHVKQINIVIFLIQNLRKIVVILPHPTPN